MQQRSTSSRLLALLALLQTRRDWAGAELAGRLEVSARTVRRDIDRLRDLGYPVESLTGPSGGYRLRAGTAMPPLLLDDEEAVAIAVGLRTAARAGVTGIDETAIRAMVKLEQVLPPHLRARVQALGAATTMQAPSGPTVDPEVLTVIAGACRDHERLRFSYRGANGVDGRREVEPHALVHLSDRWYVVAWDVHRGDWRTFRLDRLNRPWPAGVRFAPRTVPGDDPAAYVAQNRATAAFRYIAHLTLHVPADVMAARRHLWGTVAPIDATTCAYRTGDNNLDWLAMRIGMLGVEFDLHGPPELIRRMAELSERFRRGAGGG